MVEPAAAGEARLLSPRQQRRIARAVDVAERITGLQFCVYAGPSDEDARAHAEQLFADAGLHTRPAVLILVAPQQRRVEVVTSAAIRHRVTDFACRQAVQAMVHSFAVGDLVGGICDGVRRLADAAGPGDAPADDVELPDVLTG